MGQVKNQRKMAPKRSKTVTLSSTLPLPKKKNIYKTTKSPYNVTIGSTFNKKSSKTASKKTPKNRVLQLNDKAKKSESTPKIAHSNLLATHVDQEGAKLAKKYKGNMALWKKNNQKSPKKSDMFESRRIERERGRTKTLVSNSAQPRNFVRASSMTQWKTKSKLPDNTKVSFHQFSYF